MNELEDDSRNGVNGSGYRVDTDAGAHATVPTTGDVGPGGDEGMSEEAGDEEFTEMPKRVIYVGPGTLRASCEAAEKCLAETGQYFNRLGTVVKTVLDRASGEVLAEPVKKASLILELDALADWYKTTSAGKRIPAHPPERICSALVDKPDHPHLPMLAGVAHQPFIRQDGSVCIESGYDQETAMLAGFDDRLFSVPVSPTRADAMAALEVLEDVLSEVPFAEESDRSAALSAMLTAAVRPSMRSAPMFHARAYQPGTGKSFLCRVITALATARSATPVSFPGSDVECAKVLLAALKSSPAAIEFDNLTGDIVAHDSLCATLTAEQYRNRNLGHSEMVTVSTRTLVLSSGNNVGPIADMARRCVTINLDARCERPAARSFKNPDRLEDVRRDRAKYVSAALTVIRAWIVAGSPQTPCTPVAGFVQWSDWCRQPLLWLGKPDPASSMFAAMSDDPDRVLLARLLAAMRDQFGSRPVMVKELVERSHDRSLPGTDDLRESLQDICDEATTINRKKLGRWIKRHAGQVVDGLKLVGSNPVRNARVWQVETA